MVVYYFFLYIAQVCFVNYFNVYLETGLGFSGTQLALITGVAPLAAVAFMPFIGSLADERGAYRPLLTASLALAAVSAFLMGTCSSVGAILALGVAFNVCKSTATSMGDTLAMNRCMAEKKNFGFMRSFGSLGWVTGGVALGLWARRMPLVQIMMPTMGVSLIIALFGALMIGRGNAPKINAQRKNTGAILAQLVKNKRYMFIVFAVFTSFFTFDAALGYMGNHLVTTLGGDTGLISLNTACCVVPEIFFLRIVSGTILPKYGYKKLFRITAVATVVRSLYCIIVRDPYLFVLGSLLHCLDVGSNPVGTLSYVRRVVPSDIYGTAVTLLNTVMTLAHAFYGWVFGNVYEYFGSTAIFVLLLIINAVSCIMIFRTKYFDEDDITPEPSPAA